MWLKLVPVVVWSLGVVEFVRFLGILWHILIPKIIKQIML
jgi:hypothetical protein